MEMAVSTVSVDGSGGGDSGGDDCGGGGGDGGDGDGDGEDGKMPAQAAEHTSSSLHVWEGVVEAWTGAPGWLRQHNKPLYETQPRRVRKDDKARGRVVDHTAASLRYKLTCSTTARMAAMPNASPSTCTHQQRQQWW